MATQDVQVVEEEVLRLLHVEHLRESYATVARRRHQLRYSLSVLRKDFPEHEFSKDCSITVIGTEGGDADSHMGVKVSIPAGAFSSQAVLSIRECHGPFDLPDGISLASPVFLIGSSQPKFKRNARLTMEHYIDIQPGDNLVLLTSPRQAPLERFSNAGRIHHSVRDTWPQVGHVMVKHFSFTCFGILRSAQPPKLRYRPVVYTPLNFNMHATSGSNTIFSITLDHSIYKKNLKKFVKQHFSNDKFGHPIYYESITSEEWKGGLIELQPPRKPEALKIGYSIHSDKIPVTISKREVDTQVGSWKRKRNAKKEYEVYPPRIVISTQTCGQKISISSELCVTVLGIEKVCQRFYLPTAIPVNKSMMQYQGPPWKILSDLAKETECISYLDEKPTMDELLFFKLKDGDCINIVWEVGIKYHDFGTILLQDRSGAHVEALKHQFYRNCEEINKRILKIWLEEYYYDIVLKPVTWNTIIKVLNNIGKGELAAKIRETAPKRRISTDQKTLHCWVSTSHD